MKKNWAGIVFLCSLMLMITAVVGAEIKTATVQEMAKYNCTHVIELKATDFTGSGTERTFTNSFTGPVSLKFEGLLLDEEFDSSSVTNAAGCAVTVGQADDASRWVSSFETAADQSPTVWSTFGSTNLYTLAGASTGISPAVQGNPAWVNASTGAVAVHLGVTVSGTSQTLSTVNRGRLRTFWRAFGPKYD